MNTERKPFLSDDQNHDLEGDSDGKAQRNTHRRHLLPAWLLHSLLIASYSAVFLYLTLRPSPAKKTTTSLHPISNLNITYIPSTYTDFTTSPFAGPPSSSVDQAWHELLEKTTLRVSGEELRRSNQSSVALPTGGGYMAWLGVYHQLHCVKMLRQWNYRTHYHPEVKAEDYGKSHWDVHADHCLDVLRSAAMCHADTTLTTFGWAEQAQPMLNTRPIEHRCVDWQGLMKSVDGRVVGKEEIAELVNPLADGVVE